MIYTFDIPFINHGYMSERPLNKVMDHLGYVPSYIDMGRMSSEELDEIISAWFSGLHRQDIEEIMGDAIHSDPFFKDTALELWTDHANYAEEIKRLIRNLFTQTHPVGGFNDESQGRSWAQMLEQQVNTVIRHEGSEAA